MQQLKNDRDPAAEPEVTRPGFAEALRFWIKLGWISFGGPSGQIAIMHQELVERRRWISNARFLHALNFCMLLPGPEAQQLATYCGWLLHGVRGGIAAGTLFVLPAVLLLWLLSHVYMAYGEIKVVAAAFAGLKPAVLAIVLVALWRIGNRTLQSGAKWGLAVGAFVGIWFFRVPFPAIVFGAAFVGLVGGRLWPRQFVSEPEAIVSADEPSADGWLHAMRVVLIGVLLWVTPLIVLGLRFGWNHVLVQEGVFFSKAAMVTFGGAYAVLPYVGQQAVENFGWLQAGQMMDGLGLAETTPGPLVMVLQFVGFVGAWQHPGALLPAVAGLLGALVTSWVTFVPCFIWILAGAPFIERLRGNRQVAAALGAVTAAIVGVILNLALWFGLNSMLPPAGGLDWGGLVVVVIVFVGMLRWRWGIMSVVAGAALVGVARALWAPWG